MGCGSSSGGSAPSSGKWEEDADLAIEGTRIRTKFDKKTGQARKLVDGVDDADRQEDDFFDVEDAGEGEQFMAVRPWVGAIAEPESHPPVDKTQPDTRYALEYVYGYRCADSRQNVYLNSAGQAVYMTAALGVILEISSNDQKFFGGGEVDNKSKQTSNDMEGHTNDIMAIALSSDRKYAVSGQVGPSPVVFVWDAQTGEKKHRFKVARGARGINAVAMSQDGSLVACVDLHNDHQLHIFETSSGTQINKCKGDTNKIYDVCFSQQPNSTDLATAGTKHMYKWKARESGGGKQKALFGSHSPTSFACVTYDSDGVCYAGGSNSKLYVWKPDDRTCHSTIDAHGKGFICTIRWENGKLFSGGKDGKVCMIDTASLTVEKTFDFGNPVRAVDCFNEKLVVGLRNGTIYHCDLGDFDNKQAIMHSHCEGEVWGLDVKYPETVITSGDDNQIISWSVTKRKRADCWEVTDRKANSKRGGASTLSLLKDSQCARAVAFSKDDLAAVGANDGCVIIKHLDGNDKKTLSDSSEWIEVLRYSPDGKTLAVGSHDNNIYLYDCEDDYSLKATLSSHNSFIVCLDWSQDGTYIRSNCGAHELLFFTNSEGSWAHDPSGRTNTTKTEWATSTCKFGWCVEGIFPKGTDGTHVNGVAQSLDGSMIATGDDYGLVNVFRNPVRFGGHPRSLRGHSEHVVRVQFYGEDNKYLFSIGGYDQTLMQWRKC